MRSNKKTFEDALIELKSIIKELEQGSPKLDEMLILFEDGMKLMAFCKENLDDVEDRVKVLMKENENLFEENDIK